MVTTSRIRRRASVLVIGAALAVLWTTAPASPVTPPSAQRDDRGERAPTPPLGGKLKSGSFASPSATAWPDARDSGLTLPPTYVDRVNHALDEGDDHWGDSLLDLPNGPTYDNVRPLLVPANHGGPTVADSPWSYLPFTYPAPEPDQWNEQRDFTLHVADGSELMSQWSDQRASQRVRFLVGPDGGELFGAAEARLDQPRLRDGYLPILLNRYTDASGVTYERESFAATLEPGGPVVSMVRFTAEANDPDETPAGRLRVTVDTPDVDRATALDGRVSVDDKTILAYSGDAEWSAPSLDYDMDLSGGPVSVYLVVANEPTALPDVTASQDTYEESREQVSTYWQDLVDSGADIDLPESYADDAMRNTLLNNLVMGFNLTVGNNYESPSEAFAFVPEVAATVTSLGDFGYAERYRANLEELMDRGQGSAFFTTWERGIKLQLAAAYYLQTNDSAPILEHLDAFRSWLAEFARQRDEDPHGLLAKARYASDIPDPVYGIHHQSEAWRGMRDMGVALRLMGRPDDANAFTNEADELRDALRDAIDQSKTVLPDGTVFVPIGLLNGDTEPPYDQVTDTTLGSYWNLIMPHALATGLLPPESPTAKGLREYLYQHGSLFLGLTRFNLAGGDPGICHTKGAPWWPSSPGYKSTGIDQQYGYSVARFLADSDQADRLDLSFYGMLAHNLTRNTFIAGEGATLSPCPQLGEYYRSQYWPPLSPNNATYLKALRLMLLREDVDSAGMPTTLHIAPATPRDWLQDSEHVGASRLPSAFGPLDFELTSHLDDGQVTARIDPPNAEDGRASVDEVVLHLRVPAGHRLVGATAGGQPVPFSAVSQTVRLGGLREPVTVQARYANVLVHPVSHAEVTDVSTERTLVEPGEQIKLTADLETLGVGKVHGTLRVVAPDGWRTSPDRSSFSVSSGGSFAWMTVPIHISAPRSAKPGLYPIRLVAAPDDGPQRVTNVPIRVAMPAAGTYADVVRRQDPVGYWRFDETSADTPAADSSGSGNAGEFRGQLETTAPGAIADDPSTSVKLVDGYVQVPDSASVSLTGPYTLEAWVKVVAGGQQAIVEKYDSSDCLPSRNGYGLRLLAGNKLQAFNVADRFVPGNGTGRSVQQVEWHHVAASYDGTALRTYLDGELQSSTPTSAAPTDGPTSLKIGARGDDSADRFEGWIDEVAVYDHALSADQLDSHYVKGVLGGNGPPQVATATSATPTSAATTDQTEPEVAAEPAAVEAPAADSAYATEVLADAPVGYWRLGETSGDQAADASGSANHGTYDAATAFERPGALVNDLDTAVRLEGGYVDVPDSDSLSIGGQFTLEAWVKLDDVCGQYGLVEKYDTPALNGYLLRVLPGGRLSAFTLGGDGQFASVVGNSVVAPDEWHHVVAVYDGTSLTVYLDGRADGSIATDIDPLDGVTSLKLGARGDDAGTRLRGDLDEVAVYDHALSAERIARHYAIAQDPSSGS